MAFLKGILGFYLDLAAWAFQKKISGAGASERIFTRLGKREQKKLSKKPCNVILKFQQDEKIWVLKTAFIF
jgi:hypothetical protein